MTMDDDLAKEKVDHVSFCTLEPLVICTAPTINDTITTFFVRSY